MKAIVHRRAHQYGERDGFNCTHLPSQPIHHRHHQTHHTCQRTSCQEFMLFKNSLGSRFRVLLFKNAPFLPLLLFLPLLEFKHHCTFLKSISLFSWTRRSGDDFPSLFSFRIICIFVQSE